MSIGKVPQKWLCQSVESILGQTFKDFEFIIILDNPIDLKIKACIENYAEKDKRIILLHNEVNHGVSFSINRGLMHAKGKYIARMDADDIADNRRLEKQYAFMEANGDVVLLGTGIRFIGKNAWRHPTDNLRFDDKSIKAEMLLGNCIAQSSVMIRHSVLHEHGLKYDEGLKCCEDYRLWEQLMPTGKFACLKEKLVNHRLSDLQFVKRNPNEMQELTDIIRGRIQLAWLRSCGYNDFTDIDLLFHALDVVRKLRTDNKINISEEYKAFVQYAYLRSKDKNKKYLMPFISGDIKHFTFHNLKRWILKRW